jgi:hypothetical protein
MQILRSGAFQVIRLDFSVFRNLEDGLAFGGLAEVALGAEAVSFERGFTREGEAGKRNRRDQSHEQPFHGLDSVSSDSRDFRHPTDKPHAFLAEDYSELKVFPLPPRKCHLHPRLGHGSRNAQHHYLAILTQGQIFQRDQYASRASSFSDETPE